MNKIVSKFLLASALVVSMNCYLVSLPSSAATSSYTPTSWSISSANQESRPKRIKNTDSSVYVSNDTNYPEHSVKFSIYGSNNTNFGDGYNVYSCSQYSEILKTYNLSIPGNSKRRVRQYINELGYSYAAPFFQHNGLNYAWGKWSPDCYSSNTYDLIN